MLECSCLQCQQDSEQLDEDDEVQTLAHHWSDDEFDTQFTEHGYEADSESIDQKDLGWYHLASSSSHLIDF
jgi:hypothetical protein